MPKIQWERLRREKWSHLRERAKERQISKVICSNWRSGNRKIPMCRMASGIKISERSSFAAPASSEHILVGRAGRAPQAVVTAGCCALRTGAGARGWLRNLWRLCVGRIGARLHFACKKHEAIFGGGSRSGWWLAGARRFYPRYSTTVLAIPVLDRICAFSFMAVDRWRSAYHRPAS